MKAPHALTRVIRMISIAFAVSSLFWAAFCVTYFYVIAFVWVDFALGRNMLWTAVIFFVPSTIAGVYLHFVVTRNVRLRYLMIPPVVVLFVACLILLLDAIG
ncbi:MAG: hypothetical protein KF752_04870 [Pirellulaceae bacterium]|nr:hypothetical protein [Pirellulaceae bacterium]